MPYRCSLSMSSARSGCARSNGGCLDSSLSPGTRVFAARSRSGGRTATPRTKSSNEPRGGSPRRSLSARTTPQPHSPATLRARALGQATRGQHGGCRLCRASFAATRRVPTSSASTAASTSSHLSPNPQGARLSTRTDCRRDGAISSALFLPERLSGVGPADRDADGHTTTLAAAKSAAGIGVRRCQVMAMGRSPRCST